MLERKEERDADRDSHTALNWRPASVYHFCLFPSYFGPCYLGVKSFNSWDQGPGCNGGGGCFIIQINEDTPVSTASSNEHTPKTDSPFPNPVHLASVQENEGTHPLSQHPQGSNSPSWEFCSPVPSGGH